MLGQIQFPGFRYAQSGLLAARLRCIVRSGHVAKARKIKPRRRGEAFYFDLMRTAYCYCCPGQFAFTAESNGSNLPNRISWKPYNGVQSIRAGEEGLPVELVPLEREILDGLASTGYYIKPDGEAPAPFRSST
jgi:hypothetical protein